MAEINAKTAALNKKLGTKPYVAPPKPVAATPARKYPPTAGLVKQAQGAFNRVREDAQSARRQNIEDAVDGVQRKRKK